MARDALLRPSTGDVFHDELGHLRVVAISGAGLSTVDFEAAPGSLPFAMSWPEWSEYANGATHITEVFPMLEPVPRVRTQQTIALDFDGVLHAHRSPWTGVLDIHDPPEPGAFEWLSEAVKSWTVIIHTCRLSRDPANPYHEDTPASDRIDAIRAWMARHGLPDEVAVALHWHVTPGKPHADVYLDDRAVRFSGVWPVLEELSGARSWTEPATERDLLRSMLAVELANSVSAQQLKALEAIKAEPGLTVRSYASAFDLAPGNAQKRAKVLAGRGFVDYVRESGALTLTAAGEFALRMLLVG